MRAQPTHSAVADDGDMQLRSEAGAPTRYFIRRRGNDRLELTQADDDAEHPLLFVADIDVLEKHLIGTFPMTSARTAVCHSSNLAGAEVIWRRDTTSATW